MSSYFQYPALYKNFVCCVSGDSLWLTDRCGGNAIRLTEQMKGVMTPFFSPHGDKIYFVASDDLYSIPIEGGVPERLTYEESSMAIVGWKEGLLLASSCKSVFSRESFLYEWKEQQRTLQPLPYGPASFLSYGPSKGVVLQREGYGYINWKRYQGGTTGKLWIDRKGKGAFSQLLSSSYNCLNPIWIQDRIYFLSDHEGIGNVYSCSLDGEDLQRHTHHQDFYVRQISFYQDTLVYSCGGDLYLLDTNSLQGSQKIPVEMQRGFLNSYRCFENPARNMTYCDLSSDGSQLAITTRGRVFQATPFKGPALQRGHRDGVRYRLASWLSDQRLVVVCDEGLEEILEIHDKGAEVLRLTGKKCGIDWGRLVNLYVCPVRSEILCINHRQELLWIDLEKKKAKKIAHSARGPFQGVDWSPCGHWILYSSKDRLEGSAVYLYSLKDHQTFLVAPSTFFNFSPVFDREGKYLFFLSARSFSAKHDAVRFDLSYHETVKPYVVTLSKDEPSLFLKALLPKDSEAEPEHAKKKENEKEKASEKPALVIDTDGLSQRIEEFPLPARAYSELFSLKNQLLLMASADEDEDEEDCAEQTLYAYDFSSLKEEVLVPSLSFLTLSADGQWMTYAAKQRLRTVQAGGKPDDSPDKSFHAGGWFDWSRLVLSVSPTKEWAHMFDESWRLQKELFWMPSMGGIDWDAVYQKYRPLIDRIACFSELVSVIGDMHGELGTSHAYIFRSMPGKKSAHLGADLIFDPKKGAYQIQHLFKEDLWRGGPLTRPGIRVQEGDLLWSIAGQSVSETCPPQHLLSYQKSHVVPLTVSDGKGKNKRTIVVELCEKESMTQLRYREWVEKNRQWVHDNSQKKIGYVHIPDMSPEGFSEFLRSYLQEFEKEGLIIDVRYNGGGNVSPLILDYLTRKRLGYDQSRWQGEMPYPMESPMGPMVALINAHTGSDGDIFAHAFSALKLGPLIGKRTWGGVVGIWPRYGLLEGTKTSQPEYSFWFHDVGWAVENYGVDPTIDIDILPQDYAAGEDPQLRRGLEEVLKLVSESHPTAPPLPSLRPPKWR
jgi:tricorn protease